MSKVWAQRIVKLFLVVFFIAYGCIIPEKELEYEKVVEEERVGIYTIKMEQTAHYFKNDGGWSVYTTVEVDPHIGYYRYSSEHDFLKAGTDCTDIADKLKEQKEKMMLTYEGAIKGAHKMTEEQEIADQCIKELESET